MNQNDHPLYKDLYHRAPYLLLDEVIEADEKYLLAQVKLRGDEFFFQGHFPHAPVLPGALMQEMTTQAAGVLIARFYNPIKDYDTNNFDPERPALGVLSRVKGAKYKTFAKPGDTLEIKIKVIERVADNIEFVGTIEKRSGGKQESELVMKNSFVLTNTPAKNLMS